MWRTIGCGAESDGGVCLFNLRRIARKLYRNFVPLTPYPDENYTSFAQYWQDHKAEFPRRADIETTNLCNANCVCCLQATMKKPRGIMTLENFMWVANKLKQRGVLIRAFYTTGEPLMDPTLYQKFAYARKLKILAPFVSLNTNVSLLTQERWKNILVHTDNITLSFFNVGSEFERLTGGLSWSECYQNAIGFIQFRDQHRPDYRIFIGCNTVKGSNLNAVKNAFAGFRVEYAVDAELRWAGKVITGVVDRAIMYPTFRCDGHLGTLLIKWNGNIEVCSYDFNEETLFANIFSDSWGDICRKFFEGWLKPFSLCARCDYYHLYWRVKKAGFQYVEDYSWQQPFLDEGEEPIR